MKPQRNEDENLDALEFLSDAAASEQPKRPPASARRGSRPPRREGRPETSRGSAEKPPAPPPTSASDDLPPLEPPPAPTPESAAPTQTEVATPSYRCLRCGYPLANVDERCSECGTVPDRDTLRHWFSGEEQVRLNNVLWFVGAALFLRLFVAPPELLWFARIGIAIVVGCGCIVAGREKPNSTGGYFGVGGSIAAVLMFLTLWSSPLAYFTLDIVAACCLLLAVLHDPEGDPIGVVPGVRIAASVFLTLTPLLAVGCYLLDRQTNPAVGGLFGGVAPPSSVFDDYPLFELVIPYAAAFCTWLFVLWALVMLRKRLFTPID